MSSLPYLLDYKIISNKDNDTLSSINQGASHEPQHVRFARPLRPRRPGRDVLVRLGGAPPARPPPRGGRGRGPPRPPRPPPVLQGVLFAFLLRFSSLPLSLLALP